jgi:hypothetical protein
MSTSRPTVQFTDPYFLDPGTRLLPPFATAEDAARWATYLGRSVTRAPLDLTRHTRRILALRAYRDGVGLYGALLDLFIALGPRGRDLRRGLLQQSAPLLAPEAAAFLATHLDAGVLATTPHPPAPASRLTGALHGTLECLEQLAGPGSAPAARDALAEAHELLAQGEVATPMALLEEALASAPASSDALALLLEIYRRGRYGEAFAQLWARQPELAATAPEVWAETAAFLHVAPPRAGTTAHGR